MYVVNEVKNEVFLIRFLLFGDCGWSPKDAHVQIEYVARSRLSFHAHHGLWGPWRVAILSNCIYAHRLLPKRLLFPKISPHDECPQIIVVDALAARPHKRTTPVLQAVMR